MPQQTTIQDGRLGLILPGGGARNAYQAGVLQGIAELLPSTTQNPFPVITGTSAGALNATLLACNAHRFRDGVDKLIGLWANLHAGKVYRTDVLTALKDSGRWLAAVASGGLVAGQPQALLDNNPLRDLMESHLRLARVQHAIDSGVLHALAVTACGYTSGHSICYFQAHPDVQAWERSRRLGRVDEISIDHIMASSALPLIFPAVYLHGEYHGDGSIRETAPLSPALHLGAKRLLIITVRDPTSSMLPGNGQATIHPSLGQIAGYVLETLFRDNLVADIERTERINQLIRHHALEQKQSQFQPVDLLVISPSKNVGSMSSPHIAKIPRSVRFLLRTLGAAPPSGEALLTYLLFESTFCQELIELGYRDAMARKDELLAFICPD